MVVVRRIQQGGKHAADANGDLLKVIGGERSESVVMYAVAGALLGGGPIWHYLYSNHYPFSQPEALALCAAGALTGAAVAVIARQLGGILGAVVLALLCYIFVDLQLDIHDYVMAPITMLVALLLLLVVASRRALLISITLGTFYVTMVPRPDVAGTLPFVPNTAAVQTPDSQPLVRLHVILDEHWGAGGFRAEGDTATANYLDEFFTTRGFAVYNAAYSRYHRTIESIPDMASMGEADLLNPVDWTRGTSRTFKRVPYFRTLRDNGYRVRVFQNTHLDFCTAASEPVDSCDTRSGNTIANIAYLRGSWVTRGKLMTRYFLNLTSHTYTRLHEDAVVWRRASVGSGLQSLREVRNEIARHSPEKMAYFVHVLLPHRPLETDSTCAIISDLGKRADAETPKRRTDADWQQVMAMEGQQVRCAEHALDEVLTALDSAVGRERTVVIVHGDHGSRIFQNPYNRVSVSKLNLRELNGFFPTLLAVRAPGIPAAVMEDPVPVQDFIWRLARQGFHGPIGTAFEQFVRASRSDSIVADSIRMLTPAGMPWVLR